jgi:hypothetical protein
VRADGQGSAFVGASDEAEQQLCAGVIERGESEFVELDICRWVLKRPQHCFTLSRNAI